MANERDLNRRDFLIGGAAGLTALARPGMVLGANDRVRVAICGVRGRGGDHLENYAQLPNVQIAALCDIDDSVLRRRLAQMEKMGLPKPATYTDVRKLLDDKSIDAISIATPNHWHSLHGHLGLPGGQRRLRREALLSQPVGRPATGRRGEEIQPRCCRTEARPAPP